MPTEKTSLSRNTMLQAGMTLASRIQTFGNTCQQHCVIEHSRPCTVSRPSPEAPPERVDIGTLCHGCKPRVQKIYTAHSQGPRRCGPVQIETTAQEASSAEAHNMCSTAPSLRRHMQGFWLSTCQAVRNHNHTSLRYAFCAAGAVHGPCSLKLCWCRFRMQMVRIRIRAQPKQN